MGDRDPMLLAEHSFMIQGGGITMKKLQLIAAIMPFVLFGCSDQSNPVGPGQTSSSASASTIAGSKKDGVQPVSGDIQLAAMDDAASTDTNIVRVSTPIIASIGGTVRLVGAFPDKHGDAISYDLSIMFPAGALPADTLISISIDKATFQIDGTVTFGPHGIVFNTPATLTMKADNIDFVKKNDTVNFYYLNNGVMELMPDSYGAFVKKTDWNLVAGAKIPHFSMYAFGR
jgi:hypothetical protein